MEKFLCLLRKSLYPLEYKRENEWSWSYSVTSLQIPTLITRTSQNFPLSFKSTNFAYLVNPKCVMKDNAKALNLCNYSFWMVWDLSHVQKAVKRTVFNVPLNFFRFLHFNLILFHFKMFMSVQFCLISKCSCQFSFEQILTVEFNFGAESLDFVSTTSKWFQKCGKSAWGFLPCYDSFR